MASIPVFLGDFRKGDRVQFAVDNADDGAGSWDAAFYDVFDNNTKLPLLFDKSTVIATDSEPFLTWVDFEICDIYDTDNNRTVAWREGQTYSIRIKNAEGNPPTDGFSVTGHFRVAPDQDRAMLGFVEKGKNFNFIHKENVRSNLYFDVFDPVDLTNVFTDQSMSLLANPGDSQYFHGEIESEGTDDLVIGRTYWIRIKDKTGDTPCLDFMYSFTVLPRLEYELRRLLAYAGENLVMDNFSYDQAGNITGLRVRAFSNPADADNATLGVTDPEPGEISALTVTQEHNVPRNIRTFHKSVLEFISNSFLQED